MDGGLVFFLLVLALAGGGFAGSLIRQRMDESRTGSAEQLAQQIVSDAKKEATTLRKEAELQAKDTVFEAKSAWEKEARDLRRELQAQEKRLNQREENLDRKDLALEERDRDLQKRERDLASQEGRVRKLESEAAELVEQRREVLEETSGLSSEEAKKQLIQGMESQARHDAAKKIKQIEDEAREQADKKAKEILSLAIQRYAGDYVAEKTVSVVALPSDEMKGRIIGREGRNIRAIEAAAGIDLIIDDTPEAVIISGFNPVRREIARIALEKLVADGRVHPARIEEVVNKAEEEVRQSIREAGEQATFDVGVHGIHPEIVKLLGQLKYRTSYGQNILKHSLEVAFLCGVMAAEIGINVKQAKRAGLLHDPRPCRDRARPWIMRWTDRMPKSARIWRVNTARQKKLCMLLPPITKRRSRLQFWRCWYRPRMLSPEHVPEHGVKCWRCMSSVSRILSASALPLKGLRAAMLFRPDVRSA